MRLIYYRELAKDKTIRWCPRENCLTIIKNPNRLSKIVCPKCEQEICFKCGEFYHAFKTCEEIMDE